MSSSNSLHNDTLLCPSKKLLNMCGNSLEKTNTSGEVLKRTSKFMEVMGNKYLFAEIYACHESWKHRDSHKRRMKPVLSVIKTMGKLYQQILENDKGLITDVNGDQIIGFSDLRKIITSVGDLPGTWEYNHKILFSIKNHIIKLTTKQSTIATTIASYEGDDNVFLVEYIKFFGWYNFYNMEKWNIFLKEWNIRYDHSRRGYVFV